jgi:hypothetical protein
MDCSRGFGGWDGHGREHGGCFAGYLGESSTIAVPGRIKVEDMLDADRLLDLHVHDWDIRLISTLSISTIAQSRAYEEQDHMHGNVGVA